MKNRRPIHRLVILGASVLGLAFLAVGLVACGDASSTCGDDTCQSEETAATCPADCPTQCGDGACTGNESKASCLEDCAEASPCGNGVCDPGELEACPDDCVDCGDGRCDGGRESAMSCQADCPPVCGDRGCTHGETESACPQDCAPPAECGNLSCEWTETPSQCPEDCAEWCAEIGDVWRETHPCVSDDDCGPGGVCHDVLGMGMRCYQLCYPGNCEELCGTEYTCHSILDDQREPVEDRPGMARGYCYY